MTIGQRIGLAFALVLVGCGAMSAIVFKNTKQLIADNAWVVHTHAVTELLETVLRSTNGAEARVLRFVTTHDERQMDALASVRAQGEAAIAELATRTQDNLAQQRRIPELRLQSKRFYDALDTLAHTRTDAAVLRNEMDAASQRAFDEIHQLIAEMKSSEHQLLEQRAQSADAAANDSLRVIVYGGLAIVGFCILAGVLLTLSVVRPVRSLLKGASEIGAGNLQHRTATGTSDELGTLAAAFNAMAGSLSTTMVTADVERNARSHIERLLNTIAETATYLMSATAEIVAATTQQAAGAQEQAAAVTQTVTTLTEVAESSKHARDQAQTVADIAVASADHGRDGRRVVQQSLEAMRNVRELVERSAAKTTGLATAALAMDAVITSVSEIAEQTNILALNAALEASRAGEQGLVFRVVAADVKELAAQSKSAAGEVRRLLQDVRIASDVLVALADECSQGVLNASTVIEHADTSIRALADVIDSSSQRAAQIATTANQQALGTSQIHQAMEQIRQVTNQNLGSTRQMEQAARDLSSLGQRLQADLTRAKTTPKAAIYG